MARYDRFGTIPASEVLPLIGADRENALILGQLVGVSSVRLQTFRTKGCTCVRCGAEGTYFAVERSPNHAGTNQPYHINLYAIRESDGRELLMTKDHIFPRSVSHDESLDNMQPMCELCNGRKGNIGEYELGHQPMHFRELQTLFQTTEGENPKNHTGLTYGELRRLSVELIRQTRINIQLTSERDAAVTRARIQKDRLRGLIASNSDLEKRLKAKLQAYDRADAAE